MLSKYQRRQLTLIFVLSCFCGLITSTVARSKSRQRPSAASTSTSSASTTNHYASNSAYGGGGGGPPYPPTADTTGFCTRRRDMKLMCYCTPDENHVPVQKAECWVFTEGLLQNDTTWSRFYQQRRLRDLKFVIQNHGRLDYIPTMILEPLKNLTTLSIEYSQVEVIRSYAFANLEYLERITLTNNQIGALDQDAFSNHIRLRDLNLEHNQIYEIDRYAFRNLPLCERLLLNNNNITTLHEGLFVEMSRLVYLNLAHNQISVLTGEIFKGLGNLNVLKLTRNNLNFIGDTVFAELWSLAELELDDNHIERISERALDGLNNLKTLNLRNNYLKKIDNGLLRGTPALLSINVQSNELETLTFYTFQPIMDNLVNSTSELFLSDNSFVCDCRLQWIYELRNRTRHLPLRDTLEEFVCTLQNPKLSNFIEPIPNHVMDLLSLSGYTGVNEQLQQGTRKRTSKLRQQQRGQRQTREIGSSTQTNLEALARMQRRSLPLQLKTGGAEPIMAEHLNNAYATANNHNYYEEAQAGMLAAQGVNLDDTIDLLKHNAMYTQQNDVLSTNKVEATLIDGGVSKQPLGFKVRLFILKPDTLPCHDELSDPTELPLSRDLMDVRSNLPSNSSSAAANAVVPKMQLLVLASAMLLGILCIIRVAG